MKRLIGLLALLIIFSFSGIDAYASHVSGGNIKYTYVGPGSTPGTHKYKIRLGMLRDCNGISYSTTSETLTAYCTFSATTITFTANKITYVPKPGERPANNGARDVSDICRSKSSRCNGTGNPGGYEEVIYEATIDLAPCNRWEIYLGQSQCCRNGNANITGSYYSPWTTLNSAGFPTNSSPNFADEVKPMPSVCTGQNVFYGIGTVDPDGDSLRFQLVRGRDRQQGRNITYVNYTGGASFTTPIPGLVLDSASGLISFRTNQTGKYVVAFEVIEYERCTGVEKGRTHREVQFDVRNCSNRVPRDISGISELTGNAKKLGKFSLEVCEGEVITWQDTILDSDVTDTLFFASNVDSVLPGIKWSSQSLARNRAIVKFEWRARVSDGQFYTFFLSFDDDRCDFPGNGFSVFNIFVRPAASAGPDQYICLGDTSHLEALGGASFEWHVISGDPLVPGVNWFPDTTAVDTNRTVRFVPSQTTVMWVEVDTLRDACGALTIANCFTTDTIEIFVPDSFSLTTVPDFFLCNPGKGKLGVTASQPTFGYHYQWEPSKYLDYDTLREPNFSGVTTPTTFNVTVSSDSGCVREDEVQVNVTDPFPTNMKAMASDTLVCLQKTIDLWVNKGSINYGSCDTVTYRCQGVFRDYITGPGAVTNNATSTNFPMTYGIRNRSAKSQYLYLASDLKARGMQAGPINSIAFDIQSLPGGSAPPVNGFTIKIGCATMVDLPRSGFVNGLKQVFDPKATFISTGWNTHTFDRQYVWDGVSNLIVEICWENTGTTFNHPIQKWDATSYRSGTSYYQTSTFNPSACANTQTTGLFPVSYLPRTRWNVCSGMRSSLFKFDWGPKSNGGFIGATNTDSVQAGVNLSTAGKYFVYVEDSAYGVCFDTLEVDVDVVSSYDVKPDSLPTQCLINGFIQLSAPTNWKISTPGGRWSGVGIVNDTLGVWDPNKSGKGTFWMVYSVTGDACAAKDSTQIEIVGLPDPTLLSPDSLCGIYNDTLQHRLVPRNPGGWFSGRGVDSTINGSGSRVYWIDGTKFSPTTGNPDTAFVTYTLVDGCKHDSTFKIPVVAPWDNTFLGVLDNGVPYSTVNFCMTATYLDTLAVAGPNPLWFYVEDSSAIIDRNEGVFDARLAGQGKQSDFLGTITVGNYGFCGTDTTFKIRLVKTPEIELIPRAYCDDEVKDPANRTRIDTAFFRIPKGPNLAGSTGKKSLDPAGYDPATETIVYYGSIAQTGWIDAYDGVSNQYQHNFWDGKPWMTFPNIARYRMSSLQSGANVLKYQFAIKYRDNHPNKFLCYSNDSSIIYKQGPIELPSSNLKTFCDGDSIVGIDLNNTPDDDYFVIWYSDSTAPPTIIDTLLPSDTLHYVDGAPNDPGTHNLFARYIHGPSGCGSSESGRKYGALPYKVFSYPEVSFNTVPENDTSGKFEGSTIIYTNTTEYSDTGITFEWRYEEEDQGQLMILPHNLGDPDATLEVKYNLFGRPQVGLWGVSEVGCADSIRWIIGIDKTVRLAWPNVFTPGKDGFNDWWYVLSSNGNEAQPFPTPCPPVAGGNPDPHSFCLEGEEEIKRWFDQSFEKFEGFIYDRWGRKIFTISKDNPIWKGENSGGGEAVDGVYMYSIRWKSNGLGTSEETKEGTITLIREKD